MSLAAELSVLVHACERHVGKDRVALSLQCKFEKKKTLLEVKSVLNIWTMCSYLSMPEHNDTFERKIIDFFLRAKCKSEENIAMSASRER